MTHEERQQMIVKVLAPATGSATGAGISSRTLWSWERVAFHLTPLIGEAGFQSLYARTVHLTLAHCPGLAPVRQAPSMEALFLKLKEDLESMEATEAARTSNLLLATFTELLSTLIGESLTSRILQSAWTDASGNTSGKDFGK